MNLFNKIRWFKDVHLFAFLCIKILNIYNLFFASATYYRYLCTKSYQGGRSICLEKGETLFWAFYYKAPVSAKLKA